MRRLLLAAVAVLFTCGPAVAQEAPVTGQFSARTEYMLWWLHDDHAPLPLVTTGPAGLANSGAVGANGTRAIFGNDLNFKGNSGGRLFLGAWLDSEQVFGFEANGFCLETHTIAGKFNSDRTDGFPVIARPFFNTLTGQSDAEVITTPQDSLGGRYIGGVHFFADSRTWGGELNGLLNFSTGPQWRVDLIGGFRYLGQKEQMRWSQSSTVLIPGTVGFLGQPAPPPDIMSIRDYLETDNNFYGGQLGVQGRWQTGRWLIDVADKIGLGVTQQHLEADGRTLLTDPTGRTLYQPGGLFVPASLNGSRNRDQFSLVNELNLRLGYRVTDWLTLNAGYTFLYWGNVARPGEQINPAIDPRNVPSNLAFDPNAPAPAFRLHNSDFWAQGLTVGLELRY